MRLSPLFLGLVAAGCCGREAPVWDEIEPIYLGGSSATIELSALVTDDRGELLFQASSDAGVLIAEVFGSTLELTPQPGWVDSALVELQVTDRCGNTAVTDVLVHGAAGTPGAACPVTLIYTSPGEPGAVAVAGAFNDWSTTSHRMEQEGGVWTAELALPPGAYPYKLVELQPGAFGDQEAWTCDPQAPYIQCDPVAGREASDTSWDHVCAPGVPSCNSLLVVEPCDIPRLEVTRVAVDREAGRAVVEVEAAPGLAEIAEARVTLDGQAVSGWDGERFVVEVSGLQPGRHVLRFDVTDAEGRAAEQVVVPFWTDAFAWEDAVLYFAFLDRLQDGDPSNNHDEGATAVGGAFEGGDLRGLIELLPYLDDLGVTVLWLSNAQDNAEGAWAGDCGQTFAGYHAYWPDDPYAVEEHFGTEADLRELVDAAHARGMRVIMDWVANHVHETHPYYVEHPEWFNPFQSCQDRVDGQLNFDRIPETCWFAPYLPDVDYSQPEPLVQMVRDALWWAKTYDLDGFRVDAVKHMPHAVSWNLASAVRRELEHTEAGGDERFWTVGETFDGIGQVAAYLGENQLDGQFDFPLYFALRPAFVYDSMSLPDLMGALQESRSAFQGSLMSTFLGNHDVPRFVTDAAEGWVDPCDGGQMRVAGVPDDPWPYDRLKLAWTFLLTQPGVPLIYYGDELGLPGYGDPDNRQPLWHHAELSGVSSVEDLAERVTPHQASVLRHVAALTAARARHPALRGEGWVEWWAEDALFAYAKSHAGDHALVVLNRTETHRDLDNGLAFAGLPSSGRYEDVLTGEVFNPSGDSIRVSVPPRGSRVLVHRE